MRRTRAARPQAGRANDTATLVSTSPPISKRWPMLPIMTAMSGRVANRFNIRRLGRERVTGLRRRIFASIRLSIRALPRAIPLSASGTFDAVRARH